MYVKLKTLFVLIKRVTTQACSQTHFYYVRKSVELKKTLPLLGSPGKKPVESCLDESNGCYIKHNNTENGR